MTIETLLVELFTEELPPKALRKLGEAFATEVFQGLASNDFLETDAKKNSLCIAAPPRRADHKRTQRILAEGSWHQAHAGDGGTRRGG